MEVSLFQRYGYDYLIASLGFYSDEEPKQFKPSAQAAKAILPNLPPPAMVNAHAPFTAAVAAPRSISNTIAAYPSRTLCPAASSDGVRSQQRRPTAVACVQPSSASHAAATRLYVSGLSFRTTEESLRKAFEKFGQLTEVHLVMDRVAERPRGFAFLSYADEGEAKDAMEGIHGKFLDGRVIFLEVANRRSGS